MTSAEGEPAPRRTELADWLEGLRRAAHTAAADSPPLATLIVQVSGELEPRSFPLTQRVVTVGRTGENDITIEVPWLSREQFILSHVNDEWMVAPGAGATTPVLYHGVEISARQRLQPFDYLRVAGREAGEMLTCILVPADVADAAVPQEVPIAVGESVTIGSGPESRIGAGSPLLSDIHLEISRVEDGWSLIDHSGGQTLLNGAPLDSPTTVDSGSVSAGGLRITLAGDKLTFKDVAASLGVGVRRPRSVPEGLMGSLAGSGGVQVDALALRQEVRGGINLLRNISFRMRPRELVVVVGLSGAGKSTLLNALSGYKPASDGTVLIDGVSLYDNLDHFRGLIGYVPQQDLVHAGLTVSEALDYAARLRLPDAGKTERTERVAAVMADLGLTERKDVRVSQLSGGQVKRVSIGVELISQPGLVFLDEPTSGLDPVTETSLMKLLRNLADQGRTVAVITHATKNVMLADKVLFMVPGGRIAWYGPPSEALAYFDGFRTAEERADRPMEFDEIYRVLEDSSRGQAEEWAARYAEDNAQTRYISGPLRLDGDGKPTTVATTTPDKSARRASSPRSQLVTLSLRNLKLLMRDRFALTLILIAAPVLASLDFLITSRDMFDAVSGDATRIITTTNAMIVNAMLVGALTQMREIVKERDIYRRERLVNLGIAPYILSKVWLAAVLSVYQAIWWVGIRYLAVDMPGGFDTMSSIYVTMILVTFAGMLLGLFASAVTPSEGSVALIIALVIVPQVLFSGAHLPVHKTNTLIQQQMDIMPSRWAFEALISAGGHGKQVAQDAGWQLTPAERLALTDVEKLDSLCLGESVLHECSFPGIQEVTAIEPLDLPEDQLDALTEKRITLAEGQLAVHVDNYGPIFDINVATRWLALLLISIGLIVGLLGVQRLRERR